MRAVLRGDGWARLEGEGLDVHCDGDLYLHLISRRDLPGAPVPVPVWDDLMPAAGQPGGHASVPAPPRARRAPPPAGAADVARLMAKAGVSLAPGLSRAELSAAERACKTLLEPGDFNHK